MIYARVYINYMSYVDNKSGGAPIKTFYGFANTDSWRRGGTFLVVSIECSFLCYERYEARTSTRD